MGLISTDQDVRSNGVSRETCCCDLCGSGSYSVLFRARDGRYGTHGTYPVVECRECGLVFVNPRPSKETIAEYYPEEYAPYASCAADSTNRLSACLRQRIFTKVRSAESPWATFFNSIEYRAFVSPAAPNSRMLDVGCGGGAYLSVWRSLGWEAEGVEFNEAVANETSKRLGVPVHLGSAETVKLPVERYNLVTMSHVLEHTHSPTQALTNIRSSLISGGKLLLMVPNFHSADRMIFNENWAALDVPRHLYHFTPRTLEALLAKAGFTMKKIGSSAYPTDLVRSLRRKLGLDHLPEPAFFEKLFGFALLIGPTLIGKGSSIWCVGEKC